MSITISASRVASRTDEPRPFDSAPDDFDPAELPIIGQHFFGLEPSRLIGEVAVGVVTELKCQRQIEHVHRLGVRAVGELLREVEDGEDVDTALEAYGRLTPDLLKALGGDRFPALPLHGVER